MLMGWLKDVGGATCGISPSSAHRPPKLQSVIIQPQRLPTAGTSVGTRRRTYQSAGPSKRAIIYNIHTRGCRTWTLLNRRVH